MKHLLKKIAIIIIEIILICNFNITTYAESETTENASNVKENNNKTFSNGIYKIAVGRDSNKAIEVPGGWKDDNAPIGIWDYRKCSTSKIIFGISE